MKKLFLLAAISLALFTACSSDKKDEPTDKKMEDSKMSGDKMNAAEEKEERNKKVAIASVEGINAHNADQVLKDATDDGTDYADGTMPPTKGKVEVKKGLSAWLAAFPDVKGENLKATADGDWVMVWGDWSGTWKGDFMGQKATGKSYKIKDVDIFKFNDEGKITEHHNVQSWGTVASQIGMKMQ